METCKVTECDRVASSRGWCRSHYMRWYTTGVEPSGLIGPVGGRRPVDPKVRFFRQVRKIPGGCWVWQGKRTPKGYARFRSAPGGRMVTAHRWAYEFLVGPVPDGMDLAHTCRNRACVNPAHMEPVTHAENVRRSLPFRQKPTHCPYGHEYTPENTMPNHGCKECNRARSREYQRRKAAERRGFA